MIFLKFWNVIGSPLFGNAFWFFVYLIHLFVFWDFLALQIIFGLETIASCIVRERYIFRLFFFIDIVATFSMVLDVPLIVNRVVNNPDGNGSGAGLPTLNRGTPNGFVQRLRSIVKVTRILRLMRLVQLYSRYQVHPAINLTYFSYTWCDFQQIK